MSQDVLAASTAHPPGKFGIKQESEAFCCQCPGISGGDKESGDSVPDMEWYRAYCRGDHRLFARQRFQHGKRVCFHMGAEDGHVRASQNIGDVVPIACEDHGVVHAEASGKAMELLTSRTISHDEEPRLRQFSQDNGSGLEE